MQNIDKIEKIFGMIGSDSDGECLNAVALIKRNLKAHGKNWNDLSRHLFNGAPRTGESFREKQQDRYHDMAEEMRRQRQREKAERNRDNPYEESARVYPGYFEHKKMALALVNLILSKKSPLTEWETKFTQDVYNKNICTAKSLSSKQETILQRIYDQYINR